MTSTEPNPYAEIKAYERHEFERLSRYLEALGVDGWVEQSYSTEWLVYQAVSHIASGSRIGGLRLDAWVNGGPPVAREAMQAVWGVFDALSPDAAGLQEVDGFAGKR